MNKIGIIIIGILLLFFSGCNLFRSMVEALGKEPRIEIYPENLKVPLGDVRKLKAVFIDSNGRIDITNKANWIISDSSIMSVTSDFKVKGKMRGSTEISASYGNYSAKSNLYCITKDQLWLTFFGSTKSENL